jgi:hypothetical protein
MNIRPELEGTMALFRGNAIPPINSEVCPGQFDSNLARPLTTLPLSYSIS